MPMYMDANGNPVIIPFDQMIQRMFAPGPDTIRVAEQNSIPEVHNVQAAAAGEADITFSTKVGKVIISATVDVYVNFDQANTSATTGVYVPAKVPTTIPAGVKVLNVYATAAGTISAVGLK